MIRKIRILMLFEAATFLAASLIHSGVMITGYVGPDYLPSHVGKYYSAKLVTLCGAV
ncbi:MAG: hypothetical protein ACRD6N_07750 [Pyrinomonadaceae bacterium]